MYLEQIGSLERWLAELNAQLQEIFTQREDCQLLASIPGIGPVVATALVGAVADPRQFKNGRQVAAWVGLQRLMQRRHKNVAVIALANKIARVAWAVLASRVAYSPA